MSKGNKEKKKPKQVKPKEAPAVSPFAKGQGQGLAVKKAK